MTKHGFNGMLEPMWNPSSPTPSTCAVKQFIILGAGSPNQALMPILGITSSLMIPVAGKPVLQHTLDALAAYKAALIVVVSNAKDRKLINFIHRALRHEAKIVLRDVGADGGPGMSLLIGLEEIDRSQPVMVVLGDTIFELKDRETDFPISRSIVWVGEVNDAERWTFCSREPDGHVSSIVDFPLEKPEGMQAIFGPYYLHDPESAFQTLEKRKTKGGRIEISEALIPLLSNGTLWAEDLEISLDCGHLDFLLSSRRRILAARSFNHIKVDELRGVIEKRSEHSDKFQNEISFYLSLPKDVQPFFPRVFDYSLESKKAFVQMEFYPFPTLSEIWCYEDFSTSFWKSVIDRLLGVIACFREHPGEVEADTVKYVYWDKTIERLTTFSTQAKFAAELVSAKTLRINGRDLTNYPYYDGLESKVMELVRTIKPTLMHGDFCFANILFEAAGRTIKLIDPRGGFKNSSPFGDYRYDLAKMLHSLHGGYDSIIHDLFEVKWGEGGIQLDVYRNEAREASLLYLEERMGKNEMQELMLIESLLFFSMTPLHEGHPQRQLAMYATGVQILDKVFNNESVAVG